MSYYNPLGLQPSIELLIEGCVERLQYMLSKEHGRVKVMFVIMSNANGPTIEFRIKIENDSFSSRMLGVNGIDSSMGEVLEVRSQVLIREIERECFSRIDCIEHGNGSWNVKFIDLLYKKVKAHFDISMHEHMLNSTTKPNTKESFERTRTTYEKLSEVTSKLEQQTPLSEEFKKSRKEYRKESEEEKLSKERSKLIEDLMFLGN